jgi:hypothetical protein
LDDLGLVNVVVGDSGSGKTALLEALFLAQGPSPELVLRMRVWRGMGNLLSVAPLRASYESLWKDLFFKFAQQHTIEIATEGSSSNRRKLRVRYLPKATVTLPLSSARPSSNGGHAEADSAEIIPISFEWKGPLKQDTHEIRPRFGPEGLVFGAAGQQGGIAAFYSSSFAATIAPTEAVNQFSELSKQKKADLVRDIIKELYPNLANISVEVNAGIPMLYCEVSWIPEKVPVASVSAGIQKVLMLLLGIASQAGGVVLIDEIENGIYYRSLPNMWRGLLRFSREFNTQVFASTHSLECLQAAMPTVVGDESAFRLIRTEHKNGHRRINVFKGDQFEAAIETGIDVRGK